MLRMRSRTRAIGGVALLCAVLALSLRPITLPMGPDAVLAGAALAAKPGETPPGQGTLTAAPTRAPTPASGSEILILVAVLVSGVVGGSLILVVSRRGRRPPEASLPVRRPLPFPPDDLITTPSDPGAVDEPVPVWVQRLDPGSR